MPQACGEMQDPVCRVAYTQAISLAVKSIRFSGMNSMNSEDSGPRPHPEAEPHLTCLLPDGG